MADRTAPQACLLHARSLTVTRGERTLLRGFDLQLPAGTAMHLTGANGAGKTSLLRVLAGLAHPAEGEVERPVGGSLFLGHALGLKPELSVRENLDFFLRLRGQPARMSIEDALRAVKLELFVDEPVGQLSAGQKRRVSLARLCMEPAALWLLDEPFSALDVKSVAWLCGQIDAFCANGGAVLFTSHQSVHLQTPLLCCDVGAA